MASLSGVEKRRALFYQILEEAVMNRYEGQAHRVRQQLYASQQRQLRRKRQRLIADLIIALGFIVLLAIVFGEIFG